jgi:hypothetical protein
MLLGYALQTSTVVNWNQSCRSPFHIRAGSGLAATGSCCRVVVLLVFGEAEDLATWVIWQLDWSCGSFLKPRDPFA